MFEDTTFGKTIHLLNRSMQVSELRQQVIANNVANANVPNFKRSQISFEAQLGRALASEQTPRVPLQKSDPRHLDPFQPIDFRTVEPRRSLDYLSQTNNNGSNVDLEQEMSDSLTNTMHYSRMSASMRYQFAQIMKVLS